MSLSSVVETYLSQHKIPFDVLEHPHTDNSIQTAHFVHMSPSQLAKAVVVSDHDRYIMCVLPASHVLVMNWVDRDCKGRFKLVTEKELGNLFPDCETGAVPPLGEAYGLNVVWDDALRDAKEIYFEGGDHRHLIHVGDEFHAHMAKSDHATISCTPDMIECYQHVHM
jgi:Ala-tRNA(Pro) deacylase